MRWLDWDTLYHELTLDEGKRMHAYLDTTGNWTIGVGHLLGKGIVPRMHEVTERECRALYDADILDAVVMARRACPDFEGMQSDEGLVRQRALVNMAFNRGGNMITSTTITPAINNAIASGDWGGITFVIMSSPWAKQVGDRARRLALMLETGQERT